MDIRWDIEWYLNKCAVPKEALHKILCYLLKNANAVGEVYIIPHKMHFFMIHLFEGLKLNTCLALVSPTGKALCLLKTQFAKKPKNPV